MDVVRQRRRAAMQMHLVGAAQVEGEKRGPDVVAHGHLETLADVEHQDVDPGLGEENRDERDAKQRDESRGVAGAGPRQQHRELGILLDDRRIHDDLEKREDHDDSEAFEGRRDDR
jgi:hypothetical protein